MLTVVGLAIPMVMITIALTCWSTVDSFTRDPGRIGLAAAVTVSQGGLDQKQTLALISRDDQVLASYPGAEFDTLLPGVNGTFIARAMGYSWRPYPFQVVQGHMFRAANEAVAGQGFLDLMHIGVGAWISPTIDGVPVILHIVGRTIEPDNNGDVLDFGLDALTDAGSAPPPLVYSLVLKPGVAAATARANLLEASHDRLDVRLVANPASGLGVVRVVVVVAVVLLAVIGLANLLTATAVGLRDHLHEVGVLKAMGLTPRQVMATLVVNTTILTAIGVASGTIAGLVDRAAADQHAGPDERHRIGHRRGPVRRDHRRDPGRRAGHRHGGGVVPGPPHHPDLRLRSPAQPGQPVAAASAPPIASEPVTRSRQTQRFLPRPSGHTSRRVAACRRTIRESRNEPDNVDSQCFLPPHLRGVAVLCTELRKVRLAAMRRLDNAASPLFALPETQVSHFGNEMETGLAPRRTFHQAVRECRDNVIQEAGCSGSGSKEVRYESSTATREEAAIRADRGGRETRPWS